MECIEGASIETFLTLRIVIVEQGEITDKPNEGRDKIERIVSCVAKLDVGFRFCSVGWEDRTTSANKA